MSWERILSSRELNTARHRPEVRLPPEAVRVVADPVRIVQALGNLVNNAAKARRGGMKAVVAVAASMLRSAYYMLTRLSAAGAASVSL